MHQFLTEEEKQTLYLIKETLERDMPISNKRQRQIEKFIDLGCVYRTSWDSYELTAKGNYLLQAV